MTFPDELHQAADRFGTRRPDVRNLLRCADLDPALRADIAGFLRTKLQQAGVDPDDDPFGTVLPPEALAGDGAPLGWLEGTGQPLIWRREEIPYSAISVGRPGFGKTSLILLLAMELSPDYPAVIVDLRGDYECLCRAVLAAVPAMAPIAAPVLRLEVPDPFALQGVLELRVAPADDDPPRLAL